MLTALGPSFIKAGQVLANRPDIMREDYMRELAVLQVCLGVCVCLHGVVCSQGGKGNAKLLCTTNPASPPSLLPAITFLAPNTLELPVLGQCAGLCGIMS
jgi:hypothetical protein